MAQYCAREEIAIYGGPAESMEDIEPDVQDAAVAGASDLIDSYLRARFTLPLLSFGEDIKRACGIISYYDLIAGARGRHPSEDGQRDPVKERYDSVIKWLENIAKGIVTPTAVGSPSATEPPTSSAGVPNVVSNTQRGWQDTGGYGGAFAGRR